MLCNKIRELLMSDYLDGELDQKTANDVKEHLLKCSSCSRLSDELKAQHELITNAKKEAPPDRVWQNIRREITAEKAVTKSAISSLPERLRESLLMPRTV